MLKAAQIRSVALEGNARERQPAIFGREPSARRGLEIIRINCEVSLVVVTKSSAVTVTGSVKKLWSASQAAGSRFETEVERGEKPRLFFKR